MTTNSGELVDQDDGGRQPAQSSRRFGRIAKSRLLKCLLLTLPGLLLAVGLAEILVRFLGLAPAIHAIRANSPQSAYKLSQNPILVYELKANYRDGSPDYFDRLPRTNSHGQRDRERQWAKPQGVDRIIVLGDSVTVGDGIRDLKDAIPGQLEQMLADTNMEVLNFGVAGYCTASEVELLRTKGLKYDPDLVMVIFVENDYQHAKIYVKVDEVDHGKPAKRPAAIEQLFVYSHLFRYTSLVSNFYGYRDQFEPSRLQEIRELEGFDNNVEDGLAALKRLADAHGFNTMIAIWPTFTDSEIVDRPVFRDAPEKIVVEQIALQTGIPTFRLSQYFETHYRTMRSQLRGRCPTPRDLYTLGDGMHPNATGAKVAADALAAILASHQDLVNSDVMVER
jgi:lysophospholipase L1-like esterase